MKPMAAGSLRHLVTIQQPVKAETGNRGQAKATWELLYGSVAAEVIQLGGAELEKTRQLVATATHTVRLRWMDGITTRHRVLFGTAILNIGAAIDTENRRVELVLVCSSEPDVQAEG